MSGNRCGFVLARPRYFEQFFPHTVIAEIQARSSEFYEGRSGSIYIGRKRWRCKARGEYHDRTPRGERAEACARLVAAMAARLDLKTLRLVDYRTGGGISVNRWSTVTGLSVDRVKGAIHDLAACGHIGGFQPREERRGQYRGLVAVRWFTRGLLERFGVWSRVRPPSPTRQAASRPFNPAPEQTPETDPETRSAEFRIGGQHPEWSAEQVAAAAAAELAERRRPKP